MQKLLERFNFAIQLEKSGDYIAALSEYIDIIKMDKTFRDVYINLGSLYSRMNRLDEAMKSYKVALKLKEDFITYFNMGCIYYKHNDYKKAVINLEKSRQFNSNFALALQVMGLCYSRMNNIKAAEANFLDVLKIWSTNKVALTALAIIYYNSGRFDESILFLNRLLSVDPENSKIRELKYSIHYKRNEFDESKQEIKDIKKTSDGYKIYDEFIKSVPVEAYSDKYGTLDEKIDYLKANPDRDNLISLSLCHLFKGETDTAIDYLFEVRKNFAN